MLIGEVASRSGVSVRMLRHYDSHGLVSPSSRTGTGYRHYSDDDLRRLFHVECLRSLGMSLSQIGTVLHGQPPSPVSAVRALAAATTERIDAERRLLRRLEDIAATAPADWDDVLGAIAMVRGLESESAATRQQAVLGANSSGGAPLVSLVTAVLAEPDPNVAGALRWALARAVATSTASAAGSAEVRRALTELADGTHHPDPVVRRRAIAALAVVDRPGGSEVLLSSLDDADERVRDDAALALAATGVASAGSGLVEMVVAGRRDVEAAEMLGHLAAATMDAERLVSALTARLGPQQPQAARLRLVQALAEIPGPAAAAALDALGADVDRQVALAATVIGGRRDAGAGQARPHR